MTAFVGTRLTAEEEKGEEKGEREREKRINKQCSCGRHTPSFNIHVQVHICH